MTPDSCLQRAPIVSQVTRRLSQDPGCRFELDVDAAKRRFVLWQGYRSLNARSCKATAAV